MEPFCRCSANCKRGQCIKLRGKMLNRIKSANQDWKKRYTEYLAVIIIEPLLRANIEPTSQVNNTLPNLPTNKVCTVQRPPPARYACNSCHPHFPSPYTRRHPTCWRWPRRRRFIQALSQRVCCFLQSVALLMAPPLFGWLRRTRRRSVR